MIDITGPKVLVPALLFAILSPRFLLAIPSGQGLLVQAAAHALVMAILYWIISKFVVKVSLTKADLIVPAMLFIMLTPGLLLTIPPGAGGLFISGETSAVAVGAHTLVFAIMFAILRGQFPAYY
jgi:hypothetical protein